MMFQSPFRRFFRRPSLPSLFWNSFSLRLAVSIHYCHTGLRALASYFIGGKPYPLSSIAWTSSASLPSSRYRLRIV